MSLFSQFMEESVEVVKIVFLERISERICEQVSFDVSTISSQDQMLHDVPVPRLMEHLVDVPKMVVDEAESWFSQDRFNSVWLSSLQECPRYRAKTKLRSGPGISFSIFPCRRLWWTCQRSFFTTESSDGQPRTSRFVERKIVLQERISETICEQVGFIEVSKISCQDRVHQRAMEQTLDESWVRRLSSSVACRRGNAGRRLCPRVACRRRVGRRLSLRVACRHWQGIESEGCVSAWYKVLHGRHLEKVEEFCLQGFLPGSVSRCT